MKKCRKKHNIGGRWPMGADPKARGRSPLGLELAAGGRWPFGLEPTRGGRSPLGPEPRSVNSRCNTDHKNLLPRFQYCRTIRNKDENKRTRRLRLRSTSANPRWSRGPCRTNFLGHCQNRLCYPSCSGRAVSRARWFRHGSTLCLFRRELLCRR